MAIVFENSVQYKVFSVVLVSMLYVISWFQDYVACATSKACSERCIQAYMKRYGKYCTKGRDPTCEDYARIHNGGPTGCRKDSTKGYWTKVQKCLDKEDCDDDNSDDCPGSTSTITPSTTSTTTTPSITSSTTTPLATSATTVKPGDTLLKHAVFVFLHNCGYLLSNVIS